MSDRELLLVYSTFADQQQAAQLGRHLVEKKLVACVNIFPAMTAIYGWRGEVESASEAAMLMKTLPERVQELFEEIRRRHPYETPAIVSWRSSDTDADYFAWARGQVSPD